MDSEGEPLQELSAIQVDFDTFEILDVYHAHASCERGTDFWSRKYLHGLNPTYIKENGFSCESVMISDFHNWLSKKNYFRIYGNDVRRECNKFSLNLTDLKLPVWIERVKQSYHSVSNRYKELNIPILHTSCSKRAHTCYVEPDQSWFKTKTQNVQADHGHHCSLYDAYELYLLYVFKSRK